MQQLTTQREHRPRDVLVMGGSVTNSRRAPAVVIIGGGPYGLAAAAHLTERGVPMRIFGEPMSSWRANMPDGMFLKSTPDASNISAPRPGHPLDDYCDAHGIARLGEDDPIPIDVFRGYGMW